jgi:competence protein ComFC
MPDLRPAANWRVSRAYLWRMSFFIRASLKHRMRNLRASAAWTRAESGAAPSLSSLRRESYAFDRARSFAVYEGALVDAILLLKFEQIDPLGDWFARRLAEVVNRERDLLKADVVVPVPLHRDREKERGYNQAALLSRPLARQLHLPHKAVLLMRTRARPDKRILTLEERWESVRGAFATRPGSQVDNLRVLLVDDILTTGATLDACARALRDVGAKSVLGLTVARAVRNPMPNSSEW